MLAPIALYPDALLSQILMASTYPLEVVEAARWSRDRPDLSGDAAVRAAETENWDPSVKSLLAFPQVLARMAENLQWTQALGDAFLDRQSQVMDTVQALRRKAQAAGNLRSDDRMVVVERGPSLLLQPLDPQIVYVPYYDPLVVYGSWWWPAYPPVYLRPWPGYYARPAYAGGFYWGTPVGISAGFFFGAIDWRRREVRVVQVNPVHHNHPTTVRPANVSPAPGVNRPDIWRHDPERRKGLAYRSVETQRRFGAPSAPAWRGDRHQARPIASARLEAPAPQPRAELRPVQIAAHREPAPAPVARQEPAARQGVPQARAPITAVSPGPAAARPESRPGVVARSKIVP